MSNNELSLSGNDSNLPVINMKAVVTKDDIVAIGVASVEQKLMESEKDIICRLDENEKDRIKAVSSLNRAVKSLANEKTKKIIDDMNKAAEAFGVKDFVGLNSANTSKDAEDRDIVTVTFASKSRDLNYLTQVYPVDKKITEALNKTRGIENTGKKLSEELRQIRAKMTQMPRLERTLRAAIAKKQLVESGERGSDLVELVENNTDEFLSKL